MRQLSFFIMGLFLFMGTANADILAGWDTYGQPGDQLFIEGYSHTDTTAYNMVRGDGLNPASAGNSMSSTGWSGSDAGDYFQFGFRVMDGFEATLDELTIGTRSSNTGPGTIGVYTSLDDYESSVFTITQAGTAYSNTIIDISALGTVTGDFFIRLMEIGDTQADGSGSTTGSGTFRITDYYDGTYTDTMITGTTGTSAVPVPAAVYLLFSGLFGIIGIRRRK